MGCKFDVNLQKYFKLYHNNVMKIKENGQLLSVATAFDSIFNVAKCNLSVIMTAPS
jgi:hypothetical protein